MKRTVIEQAGLAIFAEIGIVIFMVVFVLVVAKGFLIPKDQRDRLSELPFGGDASSEVEK